MLCVLSFCLLGSAVAQSGQPVYIDSAYSQDYSVRYERLRVKDPKTIQLQRVVSDRNGVVEILSSEGLLRPSGGAFLYPGELTPDQTYQAMRDKKIGSIGLYNRQLIYADDKMLFSNAWAGKVLVPHKLPGVVLLAGGDNFSFLLSDGHTLEYRKDSSLLWQGQSGDQILDIRFNRRNGSFWVLGENSVSIFAPGNGGLRVVYRGKGFTCMDPAESSDLILVGTHDGYFVLDGASGLVIGDVFRRLPCTDITVIRRIGGKIWFGSTQGAFVLRDDNKFDYFASRRWLPSDKVTDIAAGPSNTVLVLTDKGLGEIHFDSVTLYDKAMYYEQEMRERHVRLGFNSELVRMKDGDLSTGSMSDSDNDGLWTSMYLGGEAFRYAATHDPEALQNIRESLDAMERLYTINSMTGFPSRSFERRGYASADTMVWKRAADPEWDWKSTTSSDEAIGHVFVYGVIAEIVDDTTLKNKAIHLLDALMTHIVEHDLYLVDWNGKPTTWGRWNPEYVNARPVMVGDRKINSSNIIGMLQTAYHFTGKPMFRDKAFELMNKYGYLENLMRPMKDIGTAPADADDLSRRLSEHWNHSDDEMYFLGYWGLYRYAFNDSLKTLYKSAILDHWQMERPEKEGAWDLFTAMTGVHDFDLDAAVWYLKRIPLDMIDWGVHNSQRKDIELLPDGFRRQETKEVLPPDEVPIRKHNANRFDLDRNSHGSNEQSAGDIWLLPYWLGRYLKVISAPVATQQAEVARQQPEAAAGPFASVKKTSWTDKAYRQRFSIKYIPAAHDGATMPAGFKTVISDRNNVIQVLSDSGVLRPYNGRLLYPGRLYKDRVYRALPDRKITAVCMSERQLIYMDDKAVFSNAWAGKLFTRHGMREAKLIAAGADRQFLISDGRQLELIGDTILWRGAIGGASAPTGRSASASGVHGEPPTEWLSIVYEPQRSRYWLLSDRSLAFFSPVTKKIQTVFSGRGLRTVAVSDKQLLVGSHDGYIELNFSTYKPIGGWHRKLPATDISVIKRIGGQWWFGSTQGAFQLKEDGGFDYFASERWLPANKVIDLGAGPDSSVLVLTEKGLARIGFEWMTLGRKADYYEQIVRQRHIRYGYYSDYSRLEKGAVNTAETAPHDSDNLWTSMYMAAELFRYRTTGEAEARQNYKESFEAMERLFTLSGVRGLFGRCIERKGVVVFHDEIRKNVEAYWYPGYDHTQSSWHHSPDSGWDWRGSASSDQADGQLFALTMVAQYSDEETIRQQAIQLIDALVGYIVDNGLKLIDVDGRPTLWGLWGPEYVNRFPDMVGDKKLYSSNIISYLQTAYHFAGKEKYMQKAEELLYKEHYLQNLCRPVAQIGPAPATADRWSQELSGGWNNSDDEMYFLGYWGLYPYALDKALQSKYGEAIKDHWNFKRPAKDALWNISYGVLTGAADFDQAPAIEELQRMPLDLITWPIRNSDRKDLVFLPKNNRHQWTNEVLPPDERPQNKHNRNLFELDETGVDGNAELGGGDVYLLPYWMARYFGIIGPPIDHPITSFPQ